MRIIKKYISDGKLGLQNLFEFARKNAEYSLLLRPVYTSGD